MFKTNQNTEMSKDKFGAGSIMKRGNQKFLVCATSSKSVMIVRMSSFQQVENSTINVSDINHLTEDEFRKLGYTLGCTLSDFDFDTKGLKDI